MIKRPIPTPFFQASLALIVGLYSLLFAEKILAAEIVYVGPNFVITDSGSEEGLKVGSEVCFAIEDEGENLCGIINIARKHLSGAKFRSEEISRLKLGLRVSSDDLDESVPHKKISKKELKKLVKQIQAANIRAPAEDQREAPEGPEDTPVIRFSLGWIISPMRTYRYRLPSYSLENELSGEGALWTGKDTPDISLFTFDAELAWLTSASSAWAFGVRREALTSDIVSSRYSASDPDQKLEGQIDASALGLRLEWQRSLGLTDFLAFIFHSGIDFEQSTTMATMTLNDGEGPITKLNSQLSLLSLRVGGDLLWKMLGLDWRIGMSLQLPTASKETHSQNAMNVKSDASTEQRENVDRDLVKALDHKKAAFGAQILLAAGRSF